MPAGKNMRVYLGRPCKQWKFDVMLVLHHVGNKATIETCSKLGYSKNSFGVHHLQKDAFASQASFVHATAHA